MGWLPCPSVTPPAAFSQPHTHTRVRRLPGMSEGDNQMNAKTHSRVANEGAAEQTFSQSSDRKRPTWAEAAVGFCHSWNPQEIKHLGSCVGVWNCTSIMYWSTMCSSDTGPLRDLYFSTSSTVGTYLEERNCIRCWTRNQQTSYSKFQPKGFVFTSMISIENRVEGGRGLT